MNPRWLERGLFLAPYYTLCTTERQFQNELKRLNVPAEKHPPFLATERAHATTHFLENQDGGRVALVTIPRAAHAARTPIEIAGLLVHEAVHVWQEAADMANEHEPSAELEAYGIQTISQHLMWEWVRQTADAPNASSDA